MSNLSGSMETNPGDSPVDSLVDTGIAGLVASPIFAGVVITQFLGAFNDNYFKQIVLLKCVEFERVTREQTGSGIDLQPYAMFAFALPFVLLSGLGGYLSDRCSRQRVIVLCKVAEIAVMACVLIVLLTGDISTHFRLVLLIGVLAMMGGQSALFGPSKYGILPELFSRNQLLPVNGAVQMTTFLAIIFGMALAGIALDVLEDSLWYASVIAVGIAFAGTLSSLLIRRTQPTHSELPLRLEMLFVPRETWRLIWNRPVLRNCLMMAMLFWFIGGVTQPAVNSLGELTYGLSKTRTSLLAASIGVGIGVGCLTAGIFSWNSGDGSMWVRAGGWMIVLALAVTAFVSSGLAGSPLPSDIPKSIPVELFQADRMEWMLRGSLFFLGFSAGVFMIPIQVYIQSAPPANQKGRVIGALNLLSWLGILASAVFIKISNLVTDYLDGAESAYRLRYLVFAALAVVMIPGAMFFRLDTGTESLGQQQQNDE